jgi:enoyl-CoA hydratase/carnithine racemase
VGTIRLNRPKMNAINEQLHWEVRTAALEAGQRADVRAVVLYGGERVFAAGADITEFGGAEEGRAAGRLFLESLNALAAVPRATIAAVNGYALGGGCEIALACDFRVVADDAKLGQPEVLLGIIPGGGGTQRLPRLVGVARAKELLLSGRQVGAEEALRIGLADRVVPAADVLDAALAWAVEFAAGPVVAHSFVKRAVDEGLDGPLAAGLDLEQELFAEVFTTEDAATGIASFLAHGPGKATFAGR